MKSVVDLILNGHRELERLFDQLRRRPDSRATTVPVMITLLTAHSRAEEAEVYPAVAAEAGISEDVRHSQKEHLEADQLAARLLATAVESDEFEQCLQELIDAVSHHIGEEESKVLHGMQANLRPDRLDELGQAFLDSREEHLGTMPADATKEDLLQQADNIDFTGAASLAKSELKSKLSEEAEE